MTPSPRALALCLSLAAAAAACRDAPPATADAGAAAAETTTRRYVVRGEVVQPPAAGRTPAQLTVRHEAIPGFVDRSGAAVGMPPMVMQLDLAPSVKADDLRPGDKIELSLAVDWARPRVQVESVRKLPAETVLELGGR